MTEQPRNAEFLSEYDLQPKKRWWRRLRPSKDEPTEPVAAPVKLEPPPGTGYR